MLWFKMIFGSNYFELVPFKLNQGIILNYNIYTYMYFKNRCRSRRNSLHSKTAKDLGKFSRN